MHWRCRDSQWDRIRAKNKMCSCSSGPYLVQLLRRFPRNRLPSRRGATCVCIAPRVRAGRVQSQRLCRRHNAAEQRWKLGFRSTRFYPTYPGYAGGILAGWAWGDSRVADDLEKNPLINKARLIITGGLLPRSMANHAAGLWRNSLYRIRCPRATRLTLLPAERMSRST